MLQPQPPSENRVGNPWRQTNRRAPQSQHGTQQPACPQLMLRTQDSFTDLRESRPAWTGEHTDSPRTRSKCQPGLNTSQRQLQSHRLFWGVRRAHALLRWPNHGNSASPMPVAFKGTGFRGQAWNSAFPLLWFQVGLDISSPQEHTEASAFCVSGFAAFSGEEEGRLGGFSS